MDSSDQVSGLWRFYEEQAAQVRQHEDLRATVTSTLAGIAGAVVALSAIGGLSLADIPSGVVVVLLGGLGFVLCLKHYERNRLHAAIMGTTRAEIDKLLFTGSTPTTRDLRRKAEAEHNKQHGVVSKMRLNVLWLGLPFGIGLVGILLIVLSVVGVPATR